MSKKWCLILGSLVALLSWGIYLLPVAPQPDCSTRPHVVAVSGQDVVVTQNPEDTLFWKFELLKHAEHTIEFATGFSGGPLLEEALVLLEEQLAAKPALRVHLCVADSPLFGSADRARIEAVARRYPDRFDYLVTGITPLREGYRLAIGENHIKLLVVDGVYSVVGGSNLFHYQCRSSVPADEAVEGIVNWLHPKACSDMDFVVRGPVVSTLRDHFFQLWNIYAPTSIVRPACGGSQTIAAFESHPRLVRDVPMKAIISGPLLNPGACSAEYIALFDQAERTIDLMHMYLSPVEQVYDRLIAAANRGVSISLVTNGGDASLPLVTKTIGSYNRAHFLPLVTGRRFKLTERNKAEALDTCQCSVYTCQAPETFYHKKVMVVDEHICVIGSYNLGYKSHYLDYEILVEGDSPVLAQHVRQVMERDQQCATACERRHLMDWYFGWGPRSLAFIEGALIVGPLY
jgi:phosphatidylserine/phosphatidylglycerophosphate/cardiolipin synthase-like enzyme